MTQHVTQSQRRRSVAIGLGLALLAVLFFVVTLVRLGGNVAKRLEQEGGGQQSVVVPQQTETNSGQ
ncbi:MAG: hypothetical protein ACR2OX_11015 [Methyloligellaceae bacterium]